MNEKQKRNLQNIVDTVESMDAEWIEKARNIDTMFWWRLNRLLNLTETSKKIIEES